MRLINNSVAAFWAIPYVRHDTERSAVAPPELKSAFLHASCVSTERTCTVIQMVSSDRRYNELSTMSLSVSRHHRHYHVVTRKGPLPCSFRITFVHHRTDGGTPDKLCEYWATSSQVPPCRPITRYPLVPTAKSSSSDKNGIL